MKGLKPMKNFTRHHKRVCDTDNIIEELLYLVYYNFLRPRLDDLNEKQLYNPYEFVQEVKQKFDEEFLFSIAESLFHTFVGEDIENLKKYQPDNPNYKERD